MRRRVVCGALAGPAVLGLGTAIPRGVAGMTGPVADHAIGPGYFGMHFHRLVRRPGEPAPTAWPDHTVIGTVRLWDSGTRWGDVAPHPGRWDFDRLDGYVSRATSHGATVLYTLGSTPRWASARPDEPGPYGPGCAAEPARLADWEEYLRRVVERYRGAVHAYELWNEPNLSDLARDRGAPGFFTGSVSAMVEMARVARRVIDEVDPSTSLATPGFVNGADRLERVLRATGPALFDAVAYHFYADSAARFASQIDEVRQVMQRCGVAALPLWNTECGVEGHGAAVPGPSAPGEAPSEAGAAEQMAQFLLLGAAARLGRFDYYAWDNGRTGMVDDQGRARPRLTALARVQGWLLQSRLRRAELLPGGVWRIVGQRGADRFVVAWAEGEANAAQVIPAGWRAGAAEHLLDAPLAASARGPDAGAAVALSAGPIRIPLFAAVARS